MLSKRYKSTEVDRRTWLGCLIACDSSRQNILGIIYIASSYIYPNDILKQNKTEQKKKKNIAS